MRQITQIEEKAEKIFKNTPPHLLSKTLMSHQIEVLELREEISLLILQLNVLNQELVEKEYKVEILDLALMKKALVDAKEKGEL